MVERDAARLNDRAPKVASPAACVRVVAAGKSPTRLESRAASRTSHNVERLARNELYEQPAWEPKADSKSWVVNDASCSMAPCRATRLLPGAPPQRVIELSPPRQPVGLHPNERGGPTEAPSVDQRCGPHNGVLDRRSLHGLDERWDLVHHNLQEYLALLVQRLELFFSGGPIKGAPHAETLCRRHVGFSATNPLSCESPTNDTSIIRCSPPHSTTPTGHNCGRRCSRSAFCTGGNRHNDGSRSMPRATLNKRMLHWNICQHAIPPI